MPLPALSVSASQAVLVLSLVISLEAPPPVSALTLPVRPAANVEVKQVVIQGKVVCRGAVTNKQGGDNSDLDKPGSIASGTDEPDPSRSQHRADYLKPCDRYVLEGSDGKTYTFAPSDPMIGMFADTRVRERDLQITASLSGANQLEVLRVQSIRNGKLYDLYYFCNICNITAYSPGPCPCCRRDLEFKEVPASEP
jgi:hypothetical protein